MLRKFAAVLVGAFVLAAFAGLGACSLFASATPAKIAGALCPPTNVAINDFNAFASLYSTLPAVKTGEAILTTYKPVVNAVCAEGATITATNVQDLISQGIPAVAAIVAVVPMPAATQGAIQAGFAAAELVVSMAGLYENALTSAQTSVAAGASPDSVVFAARLSVKAPQ